ncbi:MAG TPA: S8 family serine peptidase [Streptosporangiaceae bacterium]|nr:S8 family serine peptidase [Streptosporangiaceae bacterium]
MLIARASGVKRRASVLALTAVATLGLVIDAAPARADAVRDAQMWVLNAINATAAWQVTQGQGVTVAVIDSGVNPDVSDLTGSVVTGPDLTGVDTPESNTNWGMHGTWMASLIAGHGHDGGSSGIIGVAPKARVLSVRVITNTGDPGYARYEHQSQARHQRELADAIMYAVSRGADVISMSLGSGAPSLTVRSALQDALNHNIVVLASSGNSGDTSVARTQGHAPYSFPADYPGVLSVAAVGRDGAPARFSSDNVSVQVAAPGVNVPAQGNDGGYWLVSGTSPACALAAGVAALIRSAYPGLSPVLVRDAITTTTTNRPSGGYDEEVGFGTVDAAAALAAAARLSAQHLTGPGSSRTGLHRATALTGPGLSPDSYFGGGPAAVSPPPVPPRGLRQLMGFCFLAACCLALIVIASSRLWAMRRPAGETPGPWPGPAEESDLPAAQRFGWPSVPPGRHVVPHDHQNPPESPG